MAFDRQHTTKFHFVAVAKDEIEALEDCHVKNILISYAYVGNILRDDSLEWIRDKFDSIIIDSGAFTAAHSGTFIPFDEYCEFLKNEREYYDYAIQLDVMGDINQSYRNYLKHLANGTEFVLPVMTGDWEVAFYKYERNLMNEYLSLGGAGMMTSRWNISDLNIIRNIPHKYNLHGFALGTEGDLESGLLYSMDSSSWSTGVRLPSVQTFVNCEFDEIFLGRRLNENRHDIRYHYEFLKDDFEACGMRIADLIRGERWVKLRCGVTALYRPYFRYLGGKIYENNFYE